ncbi:MAG: sigma factor, partial [Polyangiaceae bacterium]
MTQTISLDQLPSEAKTDVELIALIAAGVVDAVGDLYDRHVATLFPVAQRILRDPSEAEDVMHDAFVLVSQRARLYSEERGSVIAWLTTLVRNLTIDHLRRRDRRGALARQAFVPDPETPAGPEQLLMTGGD